MCPAQEILNFCRRKTGEKGTGKTRHENYTQEQVFFSGKDIGTVLHAMNACLEDQTGGLTWAARGAIPTVWSWQLSLVISTITENENQKAKVAAIAS